MPKSKSKISLQEYYEKFPESDRLPIGLGQLEFERTKIILRRFLPSQPAVVLDIGGGPGIYSRWLSSLGYDVHLIDQSATLVEYARQATRDHSPTRQFQALQLAMLVRLIFPMSLLMLFCYSDRCIICSNGTNVTRRCARRTGF